MRKKKIKLLTVSLATSLLLSAGVPYNVKAEAPLSVKTIADVEQVLINLSKEQREALKQLDVKPYATISPDIDTSNSELINVIVEFNQSPAKIEVMKQAAKGKSTTFANAKAKVEEEHRAFKKHIETMQADDSVEAYDSNTVKINREYKNAINGVAMTLPGIAIKDLVKTGVVKRVVKDYEVKVDPPKELQEGIQPKMADSIPQIGVDKLHQENITGKGIKVGVLDTGIDYNHPDLATSYKGYRAQDGVDPTSIDQDSVKGWDFVNNDADPMETTYKEWQKSGRPEFDYYGNSYYTSHGTHVSGTVAAQKNNKVDYAVKGVAPDVELYSYRVLGAYGSGATEGIIAGIDKAIADGMDVINMSLGNTQNDPLSVLSIAVNNAMLSGLVTVVAAGNSGPGPQTLGAPGTAALGISVGASDVAMTVPSFSGKAMDEVFESLQLLGKDFSDKLEDLQNKSFPIIFAGLGSMVDFDGKDVNGKIALIQRGELTFDEKVKNAKEAGAIGVIIYNNVEGDFTTYLGEGVGYIPSFRLSKEDGERLQKLGEVPFAFGELSNTKTEGDHLAGFSSRGPVNGNYDIKPDVVAPGVAIFSTVPEYFNDSQDGINYDNAYTRLQGTSMAAPHVAGTAALILQENPEYTPFDVKAALMNTADDLNGEYSVYEVGAGRIDAYQAVHSETFVKVLDKTVNVENDQLVEIDEETGSIVFKKMYKQGDAPNQDSKKMAIYNDSKEEKTFEINVEYHGAREGIQDGNKNGVKVSIPNSVTVASGQTEELQAEITIPRHAEEGRYEGYIHVTNSTNPLETYQVPFAVQVTEKGIAYLETNKPSVTNTTPYWQFLDPMIHGAMKLNSPLQTLDVVIKDSKTGKSVGYLGTIDSSELSPDIEYYLFFMFTGYAYTFTGNSTKPISDIPALLPAGDYTVELIGQDEEGKTYSAGTTMIIDNKGPEVNMEKKGIVEVTDSMFTIEDGIEALWVHGTAKDETIDLLKSKGFDYDQTTNLMGYYINSAPFMSGYFPIQPNGDMKIGIERSDIETKPLKLSLLTSDIATAYSLEELVFMKEGTEYTNVTYDKEQVKLKDSITMTLTLNNVQKLMSGEFNVSYNNSVYKFDNVKLNSAIKKYAKDRGLEVSLKDSVIKGDYGMNILTTGASINGKAFSGLDGDMPFLDVKFTVVSDTLYYPTDSFNVTKGSYMKSKQTVSTPISDYSTTDFNFISTHSQVQAHIGPEAFMTAGGYLKNGDYTKIGAKAYALSRSGKKYLGTIDSYGEFLIKNLPASNQEFTVVVEVPGHLKSMLNFVPGYPVDGEIRGQAFTFSSFESFAGDINGDKMIDIKDIQSVVDAYGDKNTSKIKEDINQDGIVDETDVRLIEKNFLKKGPDASLSAQPKEKIGNKGIEYFLRLIGLELKE